MLNVTSVILATKYAWDLFSPLVYRVSTNVNIIDLGIELKSYLKRDCTLITDTIVG